MNLKEALVNLVHLDGDELVQEYKRLCQEYDKLGVPKDQVFLAILRGKIPLPYNEFAKKCKMSPQQLSSILCGRKKLTLDCRVTLCNALNLSRELWF